MKEAKLTLAHLLDAVSNYGIMAYEALIEEGYHENVVLAKMEKAERRGYLEYGVASHRAWLTDEGREMVEVNA